MPTNPISDRIINGKISYSTHWRTKLRLPSYRPLLHRGWSVRLVWLLGGTGFRVSDSVPDPLPASQSCLDRKIEYNHHCDVRFTFGRHWAVLAEPLINFNYRIWFRVVMAPCFYELSRNSSNPGPLARSGSSGNESHIMVPPMQLVSAIVSKYVSHSQADQGGPRVKRVKRVSIRREIPSP